MPFLTPLLALGLLAILPNTLAYSVSPNGTLHDANGALMKIKGISWFGLETPDLCPNGLWAANDMAFYLDTLAADNFNVLRIPFSAEWVLYHLDAYPDMGFVNADPAIHHKKSIEILDRLLDMAHDRNMLVLLDLHRLNWNFISELWYDPNDARFTEAGFFETWYTILDRYHDHPALWGVDLLNEPHGRAEWGTGNSATDWKQFAEYAIHEIEKRYPKANWVYIVEGIAWGKDLSGARYSKINMPMKAAHRLAYSAHNYGKSVVPFIDMNQNALYQDWNDHFGFLRDEGYAVIIGEWGGRVDLDAEWMSIFTQYLRENNMTDTFFWSLGPNSGDVAGYLLENWTTVDSFKQKITAALQPHPFPVPQLD